MKIKYDECKRQTLSAIVATFDLKDFSEFCKHPDNLPKVPKFISLLFELLSTHSGDVFDVLTENNELFVEPHFMKFTGDGALLLWQLRDSDDDLINDVVKGMRLFQKSYSRESHKWEKQLRVTGLPKVMRVGIAGGEVHPLYVENTKPRGKAKPVDFVGYCLNLSFRLQEHFPELGFMVQQRLNPAVEGLEAVSAKNIKGCHTEDVLVFSDDLSRVLKYYKTECDQKLIVVPF